MGISNKYNSIAENNYYDVCIDKNSKKTYQIKINTHRERESYLPNIQYSKEKLLSPSNSMSKLKTESYNSILLKVCSFN